MKKRIIIFSSVITIAGFTAFGFVSSSNNDSIKYSDNKIDTPRAELSDFGINGGINIDIRTGKKTEFLTADIKQDLSYMVRGYTNQGFLRPIPKQKLIDAKLVSDVIENYPSKWIKDYNSVTISGIVNGEDIEAAGKDATLTTEQKEILAQAPEVYISVQYQKMNHNDQVQNRQMNVSLVVTPETSAEFEGGYNQLIKYLKDKSQENIIAKDFTYLPQPSINFIINEEGLPEDVVLKSTSKDDEIDQLLIKTIKEMPNWKPGVNAEGKTVKQKFTLDIGRNGC